MVVQSLHRGGEPLSFPNLKNSREMYVESLLKEWKTLNILSVFLSAIPTNLRIYVSAAADPLPRYSSFSSLNYALMSLLYGCMYIVKLAQHETQIKLLNELRRAFK